MVSALPAIQLLPEMLEITTQPIQGARLPITPVVVHGVAMNTMSGLVAGQQVRKLILVNQSAGRATIHEIPTTIPLNIVTTATAIAGQRIHLREAVQCLRVAHGVHRLPEAVHGEGTNTQVIRQS